MHHYSPSHPTRTSPVSSQQHLASTRPFDAPLPLGFGTSTTSNNFSSGSTSYSHEASAMSDATAFAFAFPDSGYQYPYPAYTTRPFVDEPTYKQWPQLSTAATPTQIQPAVSYSAVPADEMAISPHRPSLRLATAAPTATIVTDPLLPPALTPTPAEQIAVADYPPPELMLPTAAPRPVDDNDQRKKHKCWMCHKGFDRPYTLRKHFLVHTGEKPHRCDACGHRFGVAANLNRHKRGCQQRSSVQQGSNTGGSGGTSDGDMSTTTSSPSPLRDQQNQQQQQQQSDGLSTTSKRTTRKRTRVISTFDPSPSAPTPTEEPKRKRARRAPTPVHWIPDSLCYFDLLPRVHVKSALLPLAPVQPRYDDRTAVWEERDSFDTSAARKPYHPEGWSGRLPGPGADGGLELGMPGGMVLVF